jgi:hypothetical protein
MIAVADGIGDFDADELVEHMRTCELPDCPLCQQDEPLTPITQDETDELEDSGFAPDQLEASEARAVLARVEVGERGGLWKA